MRKVLLSVFGLLINMVCVSSSSIYDSIFWDPQNPLFRNKSQSCSTGYMTLKVQLQSRVFFICPSTATVLQKTLTAPHPATMYENLWIAYDRSVFDQCNTSLSNTSKLLFQCNDPTALKYFPVEFAIFTADPNSLKFKDGKKYYFIGTSDGTQAHLNDLSGGHCNDTKNGIFMKIEVYVCKKSNLTYTDEDCPGEDVGVLKCRDPTQTNPKRRDDRMETVSTSSNPKLSPIEVLSKEATVALSVVGAILFLCIVLGFAFVCFIRHQRKQTVEYRNQFFPVYTGKHQIDPNRTLLEQCNDLPYDQDFEFPEDKLILGELLGSGAFGKVIKAEAIGINKFSPRDKIQKKSQRRPKMFRQQRAGHAYHDPRGTAYTKTTVAVKTVKGGATKEEVRDLASELKILIYVGEHKNIVNLLGACIKRDRILVILEYAPHGSLQKFLRGKRDVYEATWTTTASDPEIGLNISNLVSYSYQISRGMEYLASKKCVHRDLAARNVLVGEDYVMKIADFGLARDIYKSDLYVKTNSGVLPMKWMAIESLFLREYSEKSDVWSFGICLWEIFTLGGTPYPTIPVEELLDFLNDGNRMENPRDCPSEIYKIMQDCWQEGPDKRPKFVQISQSIGTILEQRASQSVATEYLHLTEDNNRGSKDYYLDPHDSDPTVPVTRADVYDRGSSENIANNPLPPLPGDMEDQFDPDPDPESERRDDRC